MKRTTTKYLPSVLLSMGGGGVIQEITWPFIQCQLWCSCYISCCSKETSLHGRPQQVLYCLIHCKEETNHPSLAQTLQKLERIFYFYRSKHLDLSQCMVSEVIGDGDSSTVPYIVKVSKKVEYGNHAIKCYHGRLEQLAKNYLIPRTWWPN